MVLAFDRFRVDVENFQLLGPSGEPIHLQPKVLDLLLVLLRSGGRVLTREELQAQLWPTVAVGETSLNRAVMALRRALDDDDQRLIGTVRGRGFRLLVPIEEKDPVAPVAKPAPIAPIALKATSRGAFVGREAPLVAARKLLDRGFAGDMTSLVVTGEPGAGKTRFLDELVLHARARDVDSIVVRCSRQEGSPSFWPWTRVVRRFGELRGDDVLRVALEGLAGDLGRVLPEETARFSEPSLRASEGTPEARFRAFDAFGHLLARAARTEPLLIVLDDLQLADVPSLQLLRFLVREVHGAKMAFAVAFREISREISRDAGRGVDSALAEALGGLVAETTEIQRLRGLTSDEVTQLVAVTTGLSPSPEVIRALLERTAGNPFFLTQLLRLLERDGRLERLEGLDAFADRDLPDGLRDAIDRFLSTLSPPARRTLSVAAHVGPELGVGFLAAILEVAPAQLQLRLDEGVEARILLPIEGAGRFRFVHRIVQDALAEAVPAADRLRLHRHIAIALIEREAAAPDPAWARIAEHLTIAAPLGEARRAIEYWLRAAKQAHACAAYEEVLRSCRQALQLVEQYGASATETFDLLLASGDAMLRVGDREAALGVFVRAGALAREQGDAARLAAAALAYASIEEAGVVDLPRIRFLEEGLAVLRDAELPVRAGLLARLAEALYFSSENERRGQLAREAVALARRVGDRRILAYALKSLHFVIAFPDTLAERRRLGEEARALAEDADDVELQTLAVAAEVRDAIELGVREDLEAAIADHGRLLTRFTRPNFTLYHALYRSMIGLLSGRLDEAEARLAEAMTGPAAAYELSAMWFGVQSFVLRRERGRLEELRPLLEATSAQLPAFACWRAALGYLDAISGRPEEARALLSTFFHDGVLSIRRDINWHVTVALLAEISAEIGEAAYAPHLYAALLPFAEQHVVVGLGIASFGATSRYLGLLSAVLGHVADAERWLEHAIIAHRRLGAAPLEAYSLFELARHVAVPAGDSARVERLARRAVALATACGMPVLSARAGALLAET